MSEITITARDCAAMTLPDLSYCINDAYNMATSAAQTALNQAIECGRMLRAAKTKVPHGAWMKWVEDNTEISHSTVNAFMLLASNSQRVENLESVRGALKALADDRAVERRTYSESYVPFDGEQGATPPPASPSVKEAVQSGGTVIDVESVNDEDDAPPPVIEDGTKDTTAPAAPSEEPRKYNSRSLLHAKKAMGYLGPENLALMFVWIEANRKKLIATATKREAAVLAKAALRNSPT